MSDEIREQISALLDEELHSREIDSAIEQLRKREDLRQTWGRYHLIGDAIRGEAEGRACPDIADRVREQMDSEPAILAAPKPAGSSKTEKSHWVRPLAGAALAASVAVLTILAAPRLIGLGPENGPEVAQKPSPPALLGAGSGVVAVQVSGPAMNRSYTEYHGTRWKNLGEPAVESKLNGYLVNHSEYAAQGGMKGVMPYATFISYDANR